MRHSDPNSVRADTLETRERLLGAAVKVFARHGFGGAGIRVISAEAGVNVALVGYHFGSKEGIYLEVVMQVCAMVNQRLAGAIETATQAAGCADGAAAVEAACALLDPLIDMCWKQRPVTLFGAQAWSARRRQILRQTIANAVHPTMGGAG